MISKEQVQHIAKLARLELAKTEIEKMQKELSAILDYFDLLKKTPKPEVKQKVFFGDNRLRKDEVISSHDIRDELISAFPDKKDDYIKVKSIL
jgi:aspartyl-tRNA(Asn)/glutamyl-tRNA(Gln) amidotransferase subunit C